GMFLYDLDVNVSLGIDVSQKLIVAGSLALKNKDLASSSARCQVCLCYPDGLVWPISASVCPRIWAGVAGDAMAAVGSEQYFIEKFSVAYTKLVSPHLQFACCSSHCAVPWQDKNIRVYKNDNLESPIELTGHHGGVSAMVFNVERGCLILCSASEDYVIKWDIGCCYRQIKEGVIASGRVVGTLLGRVVHLSLSPMSGKLAACSGSRVILLNTEIWDVKKLVVLFESAILSAYPLISVYFIEQNNQFLTGSSDGQLWCYTLSDNQKCRLVAKMDLAKLAQKFERHLKKIDPPQNPTDGMVRNEVRGAVETAKPVTRIWAQSPNLSIEQSGTCAWIGSISMAGSWAISHGLCGNMFCLVSSLFGSSVVLFEVTSTIKDKLCTTMAQSFSVEERLSVMPRFPLMTTSPLNAEMKKQGQKLQKNGGVSCQKSVKDQALVFHTQVKSSGYNTAPHRLMFRPNTNAKKKSKSVSTNTSIKNISYDYPSKTDAPSLPFAHLRVSTISTTVNSMQYSGDGKQIVCGLGDSSLLLYNSSLTGSPAVYTGHRKAVNTVCWSQSRLWIMSSSEDLTLCIWTPSASEPVLTMGDGQFVKPIRSSQFYYLDKFLLLASGSDLMLYLYHLDNSRDDIKRYKQRSKSKLSSKFSMKSGTEITSVSAVNDFYSYIVLVSGADRSIQVYDMNQGSVVSQIPDAHSRPVHHLSQNKGSSFCTQAMEQYNLFLSSAVTDGLKLWDLRTARCVRRYESHANRILPCTGAFSPCGRFIATGSEDHCAYIYDMRCSNFLHKLQRHSETILNVAFNPAKPELLTGTLDGKLALFHPA
ncbi:hypothetical protein DNTS_032877, partial [Danionella cerebrum]